MEVKKTKDNVEALLEKMRRLTDTEVFVGIPEEKGDRQEGAMTNAQLAYIHEFGSPAANIPARPFIHPGIRKAKSAITAIMKKGAQEALSSKDKNAGMDVFEKVGMTARNFVVREITNPDPAFAPLKAGTVRARLRKTAAGRRKLKTLTKDGLKQWAQGNIKPLIDTGQLRAAITYVVRKRGAK